MEGLIRDWGYIILFLYSFGGGFLALAVASVLSASGELNIYITIIVAIVANVIGDQFLFFMARNNKQFAKDILDKHRRKVALVHIMMRKYGSFIILIKKYIYGVKTLVPLAIGLTKYNSAKFIIFNIIGAVFWGIIVGSLGYSFGNVILEATEEYKDYGVAFALIIVVIVAYFLNKKG